MVVLSDKTRTKDDLCCILTSQVVERDVRGLPNFKGEGTLWRNSVIQDSSHPDFGSWRSECHRRVRRYSHMLLRDDFFFGCVYIRRSYMKAREQSRGEGYWV